MPHRVDLSRGSLRTWLTLLAHRRAVDEVRRRRVGLPAETAAALPDREDEPETRVTDPAALLGMLPPELWAHAIDVCQAAERPLPQLDPERMATLCGALMAAVPLAMASRGTTAPGRAARFVLTGPAGGTYTVPLAPLAQAAEPAVTIVTDATGLCQVAVRRLRPEQLEAAIDGDRELGDLVLAGIGSLARD